MKIRTSLMFLWMIGLLSVQIWIQPAMTVSAQGETNLLSNPSFETAGATGKFALGWKNTDVTTSRRMCNKPDKPEVAFDGTCAYRFKPGGKITQKVTFAPVVLTGDTLHFSVYVRTNDNNPINGKLTITLITPNGNGEKFSQALPATTNGYEAFSFDVIASKTYSKAKFMLVFDESGSIDSTSFMVDSVSLTHLPANISPLAQVNDYLYQLQNLDLTAVGNSAYDLVVMDYSADGTDAQAFTPSQIATLQTSPGGNKHLLSYMSIGEAEDYRYYWDPDWVNNPPEWLDGENPDWAGNYKVKYWYSEWQAIIYGSETSYLDKIIAAGFDGTYLDIIDAYEYYEAQGITDAAQKMVDFVIALADYARTQKPGFLIFPQNSAELGTEFPAYLAKVDGLGQEDMYYGYDGDNQPTPPDVVTELQGYLDVFVNAGKKVLLVAYTTKPAKIADHYTRANARGYVPFATVRDLDQLTINPGYEPD